MSRHDFLGKQADVGRTTAIDSPSTLPPIPGTNEMNGDGPVTKPATGKQEKKTESEKEDKEGVSAPSPAITPGKTADTSSNKSEVSHLTPPMDLAYRSRRQKRLQRLHLHHLDPRKPQWKQQEIQQ